MKKPDKIWNPGFILILAVTLFYQFGQQMANSLVPKYAGALGADPALIGFAASAFAISALIIRPFSGPAFEHFPKNNLLRICMGGIFLVYLGYGVAKSIGVIIGIRIIHGFFISCIPPLTLAIASANLPEDKMGRGIGIFSLAQAVGQAVGPGVGASLSKSIGYNKTFLMGATVMLIAFCLSFLLKKFHEEYQPYRISFRNTIEPDAIHSAILMFFVNGTYNCVGAYLLIYGEARGVMNIGLFFTVYAICLLLTRPVSGVLIDKFGYDKVIIPGFLCFALSYVIIGVSTSLISFLLAAVVTALGYGVCNPTVQSLSLKCVKQNRRGAASNTCFLGSDVSMLILPTIAGSIASSQITRTGSEALGYSRMYFFMIIPLAIGIVYFLIFRKKIQETIEKNAPKEA